MNEILQLLLVLAITMMANIGLGTLYNTSVADIKFDKIKLLNGVKKAAIIALSVLGFTYTFSIVDLTSIGVNPEMIMYAAIVAYTAKGIGNLMKIMGVSSELAKK